MALNTNEDVPDIAYRFGIAQDEPTPEDLEARQDVQRQVREAIYRAAKVVNEEIASGREQSLALTKLEEALLWSGKAIFK